MDNKLDLLIQKIKARIYDLEHMDYHDCKGGSLICNDREEKVLKELLPQLLELRE